MSQTLPARETTPPSAFESEIALIIKDNADSTRKELAGVRHILNYDLKPKPPRIVHDTYYDTPENSLRQRKISLRTRRVRDNLLISTKSDIRRISGNIIRRRETELIWSYDSVRLLARTLKLKNPATSVARFQSVPASTTLTTMGLNVIQERRTLREARDVTRKGKSSASTLAEVAIDRVTYTFPDIKVRLSEVEVEAKSPRSLTTVQEIANMLISKYQPILQQWFHGKFVTGLAIGKLLKIESLQSYLVRGNLGPKAFELIDRTIRSRRF
jgi:inorganic triphosphatase YgiF